MTFRGRAAAWLAAAAVLAAAGSAEAQEEWKDEGGDKLPPDDRPKKKEEAPAVSPDAKPPKLIAELKLGPAFLLSARGVTEFGLQLNFGYAMAHSLITRGDALYLTVSPYLLVGEDLSIVAPLGVQYDLPLTMIPYEGISAYARTSVGYAYVKPPLLDFDRGFHGFAVQPAIGAKIAFYERFHVGIEPFGFDILHVIPPQSTAAPELTITAFQLYIFGGARF